MAAMSMRADVRYSPILVVVSVIVAVMLGVISLSFGNRFAIDDTRRMWWHIWTAAAVMGIAIVGQHYTAMAAASFQPGVHGDTTTLSIPSGELPEAVLLATLGILAVALASVQLDKRSAARTLLARRFLAVQESERRRIARDLHDDLGQLLTTIRLTLGRVDPDRRTKPEISDSISLIDEALSRVRTLSVELRPSVLDDLGLGAAVEWYAKRIGERAGFAVEIRDDVSPARLPIDFETAGFRIIQQALTNVARHANATNVHITLRLTARDFELSVVDDGSGFGVPAASARARAGDSLGLLSMQDLASLAGGTLSIISASTGTTVRARFPIPAA
jgi:signal transduction histidine kinase